MPSRGFTLSSHGVFGDDGGWLDSDPFDWYGLDWIRMLFFCLKSPPAVLHMGNRRLATVSTRVTDNGASIKKLTKCNCFIGAKMVFGVLHQ